MLILQSLWVMFAGCNDDSKSYRRLLSMTDSNGSQIEKILDYYSRQHDSEKIFLTAYALDLLPHQFRVRYSVIDKFGDTIRVKYPISTDSLEVLRHQPGNRLDIDTLKFIDEFNADSIIEQIERNCELRSKFGWFKSIPITQYRDLIFPYSVNNEIFKDYKRTFQDRYLPYINDVLLPDIDSNALLGDYLTPYFDSRRKYMMYINEFTSTLDYYNEKVGIENILDSEDAEILHTYALRAIGVPCTFEYTPYLEPFNEGKSITHVFDVNGKTYFRDKNNMIYAGRVAKFYRTVFDTRGAQNPFEQIKKLGVSLQDIPLSLNLPKMIDITREKTTTQQIKARVPYEFLDNKVLYLSTGRPGNWKIVSWGRVDPGKKTVIFKNMGVNVDYLLSSYKDGIITNIDQPFSIDSSGIITKVQ